MVHGRDCPLIGTAGKEVGDIDTRDGEALVGGTLGTTLGASIGTVMRHDGDIDWHCWNGGGGVGTWDGVMMGASIGTVTVRDGDSDSSGTDIMDVGSRDSLGNASLKAEGASIGTGLTKERDRALVSSVMNDGSTPVWARCEP
jgi:hypothetical protein